MKTVDAIERELVGTSGLVNGHVIDRIALHIITISAEPESSRVSVKASLTSNSNSGSQRFTLMKSLSRNLIFHGMAQSSDQSGSNCCSSSASGCGKPIS